MMRGRLTAVLAALLVGTASFAKDYECIKVVPSAAPDSVETRAIQVFRRISGEKAGCDLFSKKGSALKIKLVRDASMSAEAYDIERAGSGIVISASDSHGLMYGLGKVLHRSSFWDGNIVLGDIYGPEKPEKSLRGIYFATHFGNFYAAAPLEEVTKYVEELAMWGYNSLDVWYDMHHFTGIDDPAAVANIKRLAAILKAGRAVGMSSGLTTLANEGYSTTPQELRASKVPFTGFYGCEICPSKPGGVELILKHRREMLEAFAGTGVPIDVIWIWPYDQGGCTCEECSPWGANGYVKLSKLISAEMKARFPEAKIVLSTWSFDFHDVDKGEWSGLAKALAEEKPWADYLMADSNGTFPKYLQSNPVPGNLPMINFPEISMQRNYPWGGYGANPLPTHYKELYMVAADKIEGGYPYSEGIYEDFNKVLYARMYWDSSLDPIEITKEYVRSEFSDEYADRITGAILTLEKNLNQRLKFVPGTHLPDYVNFNVEDNGSREAFETLKEIDAKMPSEVRSSWRWRIMLLRSEIDCMLRASEGRLTPEMNPLFVELIRISHLENATNPIFPPYLPNYAPGIKKKLTK